MISISRTLRRISTQLKTNLKRHRSTNSTSSCNSKKSVRFYNVDTIYYTHSSTEYDRTPTDEDLSYMDFNEEEDDEEGYDLDELEDFHAHKVQHVNAFYD